MRGRGRATVLIVMSVLAFVAWQTSITAWSAPLAPVSFLEAQQNQAQHPGGPEYQLADMEAGFRVYGANCVSCHGPNGDSVGNVNLKSGQFRRASNDFELMAIIANGIPGTGMPGHKFVPAEQTALIAYLRNMREFDGRSVALGDAGRGKSIFEGKGGCMTCHRANGVGSRAAPDLSDIGAVRAASALQRSLIEPSSGLLPINRPVRAVTKDGKTINGRRLNEDTYTIQMVDDQGRLVSLEKSDIKDLTIQTQAAMPSFSNTLTKEELADVIAFLVSLKG
jgi:putative heme-binding domain-containing protein